MAEETIDPGLLEQTKNQIRKLVAEIAELAESDIQPPEFHVEFLNRVVAAVAASGGALWLLDGRGSLKLQHQLEFRLTGLLDGRARTQPHDALLGCMIQASQPQIIPPGATVEGVPERRQPDRLRPDHRPADRRQAGGRPGRDPDGPDPAGGHPEEHAPVRQRPLRPGRQYLKNRQMRQMMSQQRLWNQLEGFTHPIHGSLDLKETAYAVANDGKRLVGCDRLSVALKIGGRVMVEAVSGQEVVEQRANLIRELTRLCKVVIRSGEDLVYTGNTEGFPPDIRDALEIYVDESGSKAVIVTLLHKPETEPNKEKVPFGCLVAEQIGDEMALDRHARPDRGRLAARLDGALERAGARQDLPAAAAQGDRLALAVLPRPDPGQDRGGPARDRRPDPGPGVRPLAADDRGPGLAPARGAADHLRPAARGSSSRSRSSTASSSARATCSPGSRARSWRRS